MSDGKMTRLVQLFLTALLTVLLAAPAMASGLEDPTRPTPLGGERRAAPPEPSWTLNSTLVAEERRLAVINGRVVGVGDSVDGARVVRVERDVVWLDHEGRRFTVRLRAVQDIKQPGS